MKQRKINKTFFWVAHMSDDTHALYIDCDKIDYPKLDVIKTLWEGDDNGANNNKRYLRSTRTLS